MKIFDKKNTGISYIKNKQGDISLKKGNVYPGKIIKRFDGNKALIKINEIIFESKFDKGLPINNNVLLKFDGFNRGRAVFKLVDFANTNIPEFIFLSENEIKKFPFMLDKLSTLSVFEINLLVYEHFLKKKVEFQRLQKVLNALISKNIKLNHILKFVFEISHLPELSYIMTVLKQKIDKDNHKLKNFNSSIFKDDDEGIYKNIIDKLDKNEIEQLVLYLNQNKNFFTIPYFDEEFKDAYFVQYNDGINISLNFSNLGDLNIALKLNNNDIMIYIFCFEESGFVELNKNVSKLADFIKSQSGKKSIIKIFSKENWRKKIIEFIDSLSLNRNIDYSV